MVAIDNRRHPRIKSRIIVERLGATMDISAGGLRVLTANPLPEGSEIRLAFQLPEDEDQFLCHGRVVHVSRSQIDKDLFEMGVQFQRMMARHRELITEYVHQRADAGLPA